MEIRVIFIALLFFASPIIQVARSQSDSETDAANDTDKSDILSVNQNEGSQFYGDENFSSAPGVETVCVFPKNSKKLVVAGEDTELLAGLKLDGETSLNVVALKASIHLPSDHRMVVQNLTAQVFNKASVPPSSQATFQYLFSVSKYLQPAEYDLVGTIIYEIDDQPFQSTFYNGTIEVVEASGFVSTETVFLVTLGISLMSALVFWIRTQLQNMSKKSKRAPKVEVGTRSIDGSLDEWLQGTSYAQSQSNKSKKN